MPLLAAGGIFLSSPFPIQLHRRASGQVRHAVVGELHGRGVAAAEGDHEIAGPGQDRDDRGAAFQFLVGKRRPAREILAA
ncbi:hypothetical protein DSECCO2_582160 [anaerobic digester metagenome]